MQLCLYKIKVHVPTYSFRSLLCFTFAEKQKFKNPGFKILKMKILYLDSSLSLRN